MTKLFVEDLILQGAELGGENPLPALGSPGDVHDIPIGPNVPPEMRKTMSYGKRSNPLPYTMQDRYTRVKRETALKTAVLENEYLKATFVLELGGRLWSLYDKTEERELLYRNPVFQPANLAIRNAWFSGGVEWNIGFRGHSPFTCSNLFAARVPGEDGAPILRMYEYERIRQVPFQIDCILPAESRLLYIFVKIANPHDDEVPMYWWSNTAFPEHENTRVVVPADEAFRFGYGKKSLNLMDIPIVEGIDVTYSTNLGHSADFFFNIPENHRKWIAGVDESGSGLFQASTKRLLGRKLFVWGNGPGGKAWQAFLAVPGKPYIEIQAGLAHTQMEHLLMPAKAEWSWLEAYGGIQVNPKAVHSTDWASAGSAVGKIIDVTIPEEDLEARYQAAVGTSTRATEEILNEGSGWGKLEEEYRKNRAAPPLATGQLVFEVPLVPAQKQWHNLLVHGTFPEPNCLDEPVGYEVDEKWLPLLKDYLEANPGNWYAWLHIGLMHFERGAIEEAALAWTESISAAENPWSYRNLAQLAALDGEMAKAAELYGNAFALKRDCLPLTVEYGQALLRADKHDGWLTVYAGLTDSEKKIGRMQLLYAQALLGCEKLEQAKAVIEQGPRVDDLREGENSLTDIWYRIHERIIARDGVHLPPDVLAWEYVERHFPPPAHIDFRMKTKPVSE